MGLVRDKTTRTIKPQAFVTSALVVIAALQQTLKTYSKYAAAIMIKT